MMDEAIREKLDPLKEQLDEINNEMGVLIEEGDRGISSLISLVIDTGEGKEISHEMVLCAKNLKEVNCQLMAMKGKKDYLKKRIINLAMFDVLKSAIKDFDKESEE